MIRILGGIAIGIAVIVAGLVLANWLLVKRIEIPAERPLVAAGPPPHHADASAVQLQLDVTLAALQELIEAKVPKQFEGEIADPTSRLNGAKFKYRLVRGPVALTALPDGSLGFKAPILPSSATLEGQLAPNTRGTGALLDLQRRLAQPFAQTADFTGTISGTVAPRLRPDWTIEPNLTLALALSQADTAMFGLPLRVSFRDQAETVVRTAINGAITLLNYKLASDPRIRDAAATAWTRLNDSHAVSSAPPVWLRIVPQTAGVSAPVAAADMVGLSVKVGVLSDVLLAGNAPPLPPVELPDALEPPSAPGNFRIALPVSVKLESLAAMGDAVSFNAGGREVRIGDIKLIGTSGALLAAADIDADAGRLLGAIRARVYVSGRPQLDMASGRISLTDVRYTAKTQNVLARSAAWLLQPIVLRQIERRAVFTVPGGHDGVIRLANARLAEMQQALPRGVAVTLRLDAIDATDLAVENGWLTLFVTASGPAVLRVDSTAALLDRSPFLKAEVKPTP